MAASLPLLLLPLSASAYSLSTGAGVGHVDARSHAAATASPVSRLAASPQMDGGKVVQYSDAARASLIAGVDKVANAVKVTIGPRGRNVVLNPAEGIAVIINDGVSIASDIELEDPAEQVGANLLLQACSQTDSRAGDGTTTSAVLTQAICNVGAKYVSNGANSVAMQKGLVKAAAFFVKKIRAAALPVETIEQYRDIASISANSPEMGAIVADALMRVGFDGACTCEAGKELSDSLEFAEGLEHEVGYASDKFVKNQEDQTCTLDEPRIFVTDQKLTTMADILPILEGILETGEPLLIMAPDVSGDAMSGLTLNVNKGVVDVCVVKAPGFGEVRTAYLEDLCTFSGATYVTPDLNKRPQDATIADCGKLAKAVISKNKMIVVSTGNHDAEVEARVATLKEQIKAKLGTDKVFEVDRLEQRINKLRGAVARIFIGAPTETEIEDKRLRYEDAINALKGAIAEGQVPGGGACYAYMLRYADECREMLSANPDEAVAVDVLTEAMKAPIRQIADNAGLLGEMVLQRVIDNEWGYGFNAKTLEYEDLFAAGVCDPASVNTWALENSASIAASLLTTEALVCQAERPPDEEEYVPEVTNDIGADAARYAW